MNDRFWQSLDYVVAGRKDVPATVFKYAHLFPHVILNDICSGIRRFDRSVERQACAKGVLEPFSVHTLRRCLNRVEYIDADFYEIRNQGKYGTVSVSEYGSLRGFFVNQTIQLLFQRFDECPVERWGN